MQLMYIAILKYDRINVLRVCNTRS